LEKEKHVGGLCRSKNINGYIFDVGGSHIFFSRDKEMIELIKEIMNNKLCLNNRNTVIQLRDAIVQYPIENGMYKLKKEIRYRILKDYFENKLVGDFNGISFGEYLNYAFGKTLTDLYFKPYNEKVWNANLDDISLEWIKDRLPSPTIDDIIKSAVGIKTEGYTHQSKFYYPLNGGISQFIKQIEKINIKKGNKIETSAEVKNIKKKNNRFYIKYNKKEIEANNIISTIPLPELTKLIDKIPQEIVKASNSLKYNGVITILIGLKRKEKYPFSWVYFPYKNQGEFNRIAYLSSYSPNNSPKGKSSILVEITYDNKKKIYDIDDLLNSSINRLEELNYLKKEEIEVTSYYNNKYGYLVFNHEYLNNLSLIKNYLENIEIKTFGRFAEFTYYNMDNILNNAKIFTNNNNI